MNVQDIKVDDEICGWIYNVHERGVQLHTGKVLRIYYPEKDWLYQSLDFVIRDNDTGYEETIMQRNIADHIAK